jgi:NADH-quinone oxidoreductase subunit L
MVSLVWLIPALPLLGFLILLAIGPRLGEPLAGWLATVMVAGSFVVSVLVFIGLHGEPDHTTTFTLFTWIPAGRFNVDVGFLLDPLSSAMILFVTGVSALIHLYSIGYMHGDKKFSKFFLYLNLFVFSMLLLVLGDNLLLTFVGWEGVGTCSYLLISFWFEKPANASAGKKAFVTNRVGDWGFMVGIFITWFTFGTIQYTQFIPVSPGAATTTATVISLMLFIGAVGKSAQIPLYLWLPDAMAGPTPVSALIHAATMVTAGVYLMVRINPMLHAASPWLPTLIAWVGVITALFAATIAMAQTDIKKVLAYSTVSQLGYMFLAVGVGGYWVAIFHMITHAFFKALLFLGAGSVIHGMDGEQDLRRMGGLRKLMPITAATFIVGWLAIAGVPPFSGFWSKDEILTYAFHDNIALYLVGLFTALLTAFYMSRQVYLVFYGKARWNDPTEPSTHEAHSDADAAAQGAEAAEDAAPAAAVAVAVDEGEHHEIHPHESPWVMWVPLVVLAVFAAIAGFINLPFADSTKYLENWLEPVTGRYGAVVDYSNGTIVVLLTISTIVALTGIGIAYAVYRKHKFPAEWFEQPLFLHGWYYDWAVTAFMGGPGRIAFNALSWFDRTIIDGAVNGVGALARDSGSIVRKTQSGLVRTYALAITIGAVLLMIFVLTRVNW